MCVSSITVVYVYNSTTVAYYNRITVSAKKINQSWIIYKVLGLNIQQHLASEQLIWLEKESIDDTVCFPIYIPY